MVKKFAFVLAALSALLITCSCTDNVRAPKYFIGTNMWYAATLGEKECEGGRERLCAELDSLKALGITNLRISAVDGKYEGLEYALEQMGRRGIQAVVFLNNAWEWSKGFATYLDEAGEGPCKFPATDGYGAYMADMARFSTSVKAQELFYEYLKATVTRFKGNPAIYAWEICNEPRCFSDDPAVRDGFVNFIATSARLIKEIDPSTLVTTGSEGTFGCEQSYDLCRRIHQVSDIDYITAHIWPYNWSWIRENDICGGVDAAIENTGKYIEEHLHLAAETGKPLVIEEFGYPRDGFEFAKGTPTTGRDAYYEFVFSHVIKSALEGGYLLGCNFWAWNGLANPAHVYWEEGDDYCGDPAQEQQGLNGVFLGDEGTVELIKKTTEQLRSIPQVDSPAPQSWLYTDSGKCDITFTVTGSAGSETSVDIALIRDLSLMSEVKDTVFADTKAFACTGKPQAVTFSATLEPGFYQVNASHSKPFNIGVAPEQVISPADAKEDFDSFWSTTLDELARIPLEVEMTLDEEHSNAVRKQYIVKFKSLGGELAGGRYIEPVAEGKYPAYIEYMGYGADVYPYDPDARPEAIQFLVSVRDQGIFRTENRDWIDRNLSDKYKYYYRGAFCDVVKAIDFICSREKTDLSKVFAQGESQGGAFTWIAGALGGGRIKAIAPAVPFLGDYEDYSRIVWWPVWEVFQAADAQGVSREDLFDVLSYFDVKNFTARVTCPVYMAFGLQDPVCPPHTNFSEYNNAVNAASRQYHCVPTCGHSMWLEKSWSEARDAWFAAF